MKKQKKHSYDDWWNGEIYIETCSIIYKDGDNPIRAEWVEIVESDISKIKEKQKELFEQARKELLENWKKIFSENYQRSELKDVLLRSQLTDFKQLLNSNIELKPIGNNDKGSLTLSNRTLLFTTYELSTLREYFQDFIRDGKERDYDFIHSPNFLFQRKNELTPQMYAQVSWDFHRWLKSFIPKEEVITEKELSINKTSTKNKIDNTQKRYWFKVGLLFANGEMEALMLKYENGTMSNFSAIARELGNEYYRPFISETRNNNGETDKNIFADQNKMAYIITYCEENGITVVDSFKKYLKIAKI